jgi:hypothetical protein
MRIQTRAQIESARDRSLWRFLGALAAHRIIDRPIQPCDESPGCPGSCILRVCQSRTLGLPRGCILRRLRRRISPGCPGSSALQLCRRWFLGLPRVPHPSAMPLGGSPGCPGSSLCLRRLPVFPPGRPGFRTFRLFRRWIFRVAPESRILSALRVVISRVAPVPRSSCRASRRFHQVALVSAPSGSAGDGASGCPASRILRRCCLPILRVAPRPRSSASPPGVSTGLPRLPRLPAVPEVNLRVAPNLPALWRCRNCVLRLP